MELKELMKKQRTLLNLTQQDVADACKVARSTYCRWEKGFTKDMKRSNISDLARVLCLDPAQFILDEKELDKYGWEKFFDSANFNKEELEQLEEYGKYIISKRNNKC